MMPGSGVKILESLVIPKPLVIEFFLDIQSYCIPGISLEDIFPLDLQDFFNFSS